MKHKSHQVFAPWQYAISNVFYFIIFITGLVAVLAITAYVFLVLQPRFFGMPTQASATRYYPYNDSPDAGKYVEYTFSAGTTQYKDSQEVSEAIYAKRPASFRVWYMPNNPGGSHYAAIRDYGDIVAAGVGILAGILFMYLPAMGRGIDEKIEARKDVAAMKGCICGADPSLTIPTSNYNKVMERVKGVVFLVLIPVLAWATIATGDADSYLQFGKLVSILAVVYSWPLVQAAWQRRNYRNHTSACKLRQIWFSSIYSP